MGFIYLRTNKVNGKKYVGKATDLKTRQSDWNNLNKPYAGPAINAAREKYGIEVFGFEILKECNDNELDYWEKYYIKELNTKPPYGYNLTDGGEGGNTYICKNEKEMNKIKQKIGESNKGKNKGKTPWNKGRKHSEETKKKISEALKGKESWWKGKHLTEETRMKISESNKGKEMSEESRRKIREAHLGMKHTEESKRKMSEKQKNKKPVLQIDKNTNEVIAEFPSIMEAQRKLGCSQIHITHCCKGKRKTCGGFIWKYKSVA